jgi:hypothetical protein
LTRSRSVSIETRAIEDPLNAGEANVEVGRWLPGEIGSGSPYGPTVLTDHWCSESWTMTDIKS